MAARCAWRLELELDLFFLVPAFVLDGELGASRNADALARNLDAEGLVGLQGVRESAQLRHDIRGGVDALDVTCGFGHR
jgi:hypothetical protein